MKKYVLIFMCSFSVKAQEWPYRCDPQVFTPAPASRVPISWESSGAPFSVTTGRVRPPASAFLLEVSGIKKLSGVEQVLADVFISAASLDGRGDAFIKYTVNAEGEAVNCAFSDPSIPTLINESCSGNTVVFRGPQGLSSNYLDLGLAVTLITPLVDVNLPAEPVSEYGSASIKITVNPWPVTVTLEGLASGNGTYNFYSERAVKYQCDYIPVMPSIQVPNEINFNAVNTGGSVKTKSFSVNLTSGTTLPPATLTFSSGNGANGYIHMNGARVTIFNDATDWVPLDTAVTLTDRIMNFTLSLDTTGAVEGPATTDMVVTVNFN